MESNADEINAMPYILERQGTVVEASTTFCDFTGYNRDEILGNKADKVLNGLLRINIDTNILPDKEVEAFLFTKALESRNIIIKRVQNDIQTIVYSFTEIPGSRIEDKVQFLNYLYHNSKTGIAIHSASDFLMLKANQTYLNFYEEPYNQASVSLGKPIYEIDKAFRKSFAEENWLKLLGGNHLFEVKEMPYVGFERGITYWNIIMVPIYVDGMIKYLAQMAEEVTETVRQRQIIEEQAEIIKLQKEQLETIIENINDAIFVYDENKNYLYCNTIAKEYFPGASLNKFGDALHQYKYYDFDGNLLSVDDMTISRVYRGETIIGQKMTLRNSKSAKHISVNGKPVYDGNGKIKFTVLCSHDISDIRQAEMELQEAMILSDNRTKQLNSIVNNIDQAIMATDAEGNMIIMNPVALEIHDVSSIEEYKNICDYTSIFEGYSLDGKLIPFKDWPLSRVLRGEVFSNCELWVYRKDKDKKWLGIFGGMPVYDKSGKLLMAVITIYDITDKYMQQEYLLNVEKEKNEVLEASMKLKEEFLYCITHEFKTPLTVITSALQTMNLLCKQQMPEKANKFLDTIRQNTNRQLRLVNNLLDITRLNSGHIKLNKNKFDIVHITKAIVNSIQLYAQQKSITVTFASNEVKKKIYIDDEKYERILLNLLSNALKFTPRGKSVSVNLTSKKFKNRNMISVSVQDEGIGIPKDKQEYIFERFGQIDTSLARQEEGTGIGLYLVKILINAMGGHILLESEEGKGSTFTIMLPTTKGMTYDKTSADSNTNGQLIQNDNRLIQSVAIEFSDIYL